jgi:hypothetical protein
MIIARRLPARTDAARAGGRPQMSAPGVEQHEVRKIKLEVELCFRKDRRWRSRGPGKL